MFVLWESCSVGALQCGEVAVWRSCGVGELRFGGSCEMRKVTVWGGVTMWGELRGGKSCNDGGKLQCGGSYSVGKLQCRGSHGVGEVMVWEEFWCGGSCRVGDLQCLAVAV